MSPLLVRPETPADIPQVHTVNAAAFGQPDEADLVDALRDTVKPFISLVAIDAGQIVGHVAFSPVNVEGHASAPLLMGLAPMAVTPLKQRQRVGMALGERGLELCRELGAVAAIVLGHPTYYPRFGFVPASRFGLRFSAEVPDDVFMALELVPGALADIAGVVHYAPPFEAAS